MTDIMVLASSRRGNCYHVTDGVTPILLECGIPFKGITRGLGFQVSGVAGCLVTHEHKDHCKAATDVMQAGVDVYASTGTIEALGISGHRVKPVRALEQFELGTWTILPFNVEHDAAEPLGFLLANQAGDKLLYLTDTAYCRYRFNALTHILIEANYSLDILRTNVTAGVVDPEHKRRILKSHMALETVKGFLKANDLSQVREIHLTHLSDGNSDAERFKREIQAATGKPVYVAAERE